MKSFFSKFKEGLKKSTPTFYKAFGKVGGLFGGRKIDASTLDELEEALYMADFGVETTEEVLEAIREAYRKERDLRGQEAARIGASVLARILEGAEGRLDPDASRPEVIALIGVNGSGKTTTTAKLARLFQNDGLRPLVGACDTFRAAANEQIRTWCERLDVELVSSQHGADAAAVAYDAYAAARSRGADILLLDTAGRLHNKANLMKELQKIRRVLQKHDEGAPQHSWLVVDGSIGSNSIEQARVFHEAFGLTGLIVTKLDGTSRGGALVGIYRELGLPIYFVGLGEKADDLQPFSIHHYTHAIFGLED
jgi:fused signal recognition particle receptor